MAVGDLTGDGRPELVVSDKAHHAVMVFANRSDAGRRRLLRRTAATAVRAGRGVPS